MREALAEDKARRQHAMDVLLDATRTLDLSDLDVLEVMLSMFANAVVHLGADDDTAIKALSDCLTELRARGASEPKPTIN
jgi:hypothetical protein